MTDTTTSTTAEKFNKRIVSLDQFRGYTVAGMFLVNYMGFFVVCPIVLKHHNTYCSYADTIMPHFLFAVGFAYRLTFGRRVQTDGAVSAYARVVRRLLGLVLVSLIMYRVDPIANTWEELQSLGIWGAIADPLKRNWFQTLMHIAVTSLWITPVIRARASVRVGFMIFSAVAHVILSYYFYFTWVNTSPNGIDGGPLGFLTWTIPAIIGTLACDWVVEAEGLPRVKPILFWSFTLMLLGWAISCGTRFYDVPISEQLATEKLATHPVIPDERQWEAKQGEPLSAYLAEPPFVKPPEQDQRQWNYWMMSQRAGTLSYLVFSAGLSLFVYLLFHLACDRGNLQIPLFRTLGTNALIAYILQELVGEAVKPFTTKDAANWYAWGSFVLFFWVTWLIVRHLEKNKIHLRL
ncbi:acyltransferase family protein [Gimesia algae]|uniref:Acyltransferase family protein n=1 Tax=Gimesia algae TaxID=2527971 RepID=A0A517VE62_9PLAN|nr:acyltransferase family protein [Gimesia algae]QDT91294.1 Acyltransferase family protein [Gimesia algae]